MPDTIAFMDDISLQGGQGLTDVQHLQQPELSDDYASLLCKACGQNYRNEADSCCKPRLAGPSQSRVGISLA